MQRPTPTTDYLTEVFPSPDVLRNAYESFVDTPILRSVYPALDFTEIMALGVNIRAVGKDTFNDSTQWSRRNPCYKDQFGSYAQLAQEAPFDELIHFFMYARDRFDFRGLEKRGSTLEIFKEQVANGLMSSISDALNPFQGEHLGARVCKIPLEVQEGLRYQILQVPITHVSDDEYASMPGSQIWRQGGSRIRQEMSYGTRLQICAEDLERHFESSMPHEVAVETLPVFLRPIPKKPVQNELFGASSL
jgi:hypothetical protein